MRPVGDIRRAQALVEAGWSVREVAAEIGVSRTAVRDWRDRGFEQVIAQRAARLPPSAATRGGHRLDVGPPGSHRCVAPRLAQTAPAAYAYLLGQYLGDGTVNGGPKAVYKVRFFCCSDYPGIIARTIATARAVLPGRVTGRKIRGSNLVIVTSYWKHMRCLFPQDGPGRKHERPIVLADWQEEIRQSHPERFLRGLIESDGCRTINRVNGGEYPRYMFANVSDDIRALCTLTLEQLGVHWTTANARNIAVTRRPDVAYLDTFIGPKW